MGLRGRPIKVRLVLMAAAAFSLAACHPTAPTALPDARLSQATTGSEKTATDAMTEAPGSPWFAEEAAVRGLVFQH